jgi:UDP-N-acetyl-D-glucosamine dehydrogenase
MDDGRTRVGVVGLGYVGLPLALAMHDAGYDVVGVDVDEQKVSRLRAGESTVNDVTDAAVASAVEEGLAFTTDYQRLADADGISVCVPTPLRKTDTPDLSYVLDAAERLAPVVPEGCTVVVESTVYPGATEEAVGRVLAENGAEIGRDIYLAFSPERIDPGNEAYGPTDIPKVLGGVTAACGDRATALYEPVFDEVVRVDSATEAELVKLLENTFRAVNIGLINELAQVAHELDVDIWNAIAAAETKPFGFMPFYPGPGLGGHCIPVDPFYLSWKADQHGVETRFIDLADTVNREMPGHVVDRVVALLNDRGVALSNADVLVVGAAYKPDVSDGHDTAARPDGPRDAKDELRKSASSALTNHVFRYCPPHRYH